MKHFWLDARAQALMDGATSSAAGYGHIGLFVVGKAWKRRVEAMVGSKVASENYLRAFNVTGDVRFGGIEMTLTGWQMEPEKEVRAIIRLNVSQAMMMKLRHGGSDEGWVRADPTGEFWGNMLIAQAAGGVDLGQRNFVSGARGMMRNFLNDGEFGPTIASVANHADAVEPETRAAFVLEHGSEWYRAANAVDQLFEQDARRDEAWKARRYGPPAWQVKDSGWTSPADTMGGRWAQDWWRCCNNAHFRASRGIPAI